MKVATRAKTAPASESSGYVICTSFVRLLCAIGKEVIWDLVQSFTFPAPVCNVAQNLSICSSHNRYIQSRGSTSRVLNEAKQIDNEQLGNNNYAAKKILEKRFGMSFAPTAEAKHDAINEWVERGRSHKSQSANRIYKSKTAKSAAVLPRINRIDPTAERPQITRADVSKGIYNMVQRGLIPADSDLGPAFGGPAPLSASVMAMHDQTHLRTQPVMYSNSSFNDNTLKLELVDSTGTKRAARKPIAYKGKRTTSSAPAKEQQPNPVRSKTITLEGHEPKARTKKKSAIDIEENKQAFAETVEKIWEYNKLLDEFSLHRFVIRKGITLSSTPGFESYKRKNAVVWGATVTVIKRLEALMQEYAIPLAYIDGGRVVELAKDELTVPTREQLLNCITNMDQVMPLMKIRGRRFHTGVTDDAKIGDTNKKYSIGQVASVTLIQSLMRMHITRKKFRAYTGSHDSVRA